MQKELDTNLISDAVFSDDGKYRYALWRYWNIRAAKNGDARAIMFIMANPSTAGKYKDDPTIIKCAKFAQCWGYDGLYIGNLFAIVDTHWRPTIKPEDKIGVDCDQWLITMSNSSVIRVAAWGFLGGYHPERASAVRLMMPELYHLGLSKDGKPKHPLYLPMDTEPTLWEK